MLQVPIPEASRKDKKLCQSFGQLVFKICYSLFFHASTRFQKSLVSAKQIWAPRGIPQCPKQAQRPHSGKQFTACPASGMCDSHCAPGIGQGHQGENIQEEIRAAVWLWKVAAHVPFLNMWPQALPFTLRCYLCSIQVFREVKCFQSSPSPAPIYKYNTATINSVYLYFTIVCLADVKWSPGQPDVMLLSQGLFGKQRNPHKALFSRLVFNTNSSICFFTAILRGFLRNSHQMGMRTPAPSGWRETVSSAAQPEHLKVKCYQVSSLLGLGRVSSCTTSTARCMIPPLLLRLWYSPETAVNQFSSLKSGI